jgi:hypothetical protein
MTFTSKNTTIIVALIIVVAGLAWYFLGSGGTGGTASPLTATAEPNPVETKFLTLTNELSPISFNPQIFSDARFMSLVDIHTTINPEPIGRTDPFAPLGSGSSKTTTTSSGAGL